jgi:cytochrome c oxidase subunit 2
MGLFGKTVQLEDGRSVVADENYIRESILNPQAKIVAGFKPIMPTFQGQVTEESLGALVSYVKSLAQPQQKTVGAVAQPDSTNESN